MEIPHFMPINNEMSPEFITRTTCRICGATDLIPYLDLGTMPLANAIRDPNDMTPEFRAPLAVLFCPHCALSQLSVVVPPERMFSYYVYRSEISQTWCAHCVACVDEAVVEAGLKESDLVVDIGSNDGTLLSAFHQRGFRTVGVDPARNLSESASRKGSDVLCEFWSAKAAEHLVAAHGKPALITATNVLAHVDDLDDFFSGVGIALGDNGVFVVEVPYMGDLVEKSEFDTIYHEHLSYFLVAPLLTLAARHGFQASYARRIPIHGGGLRLYFRKGVAQEPVQSVRALLAFEQDAGLHLIRPYERFARQVKSIQHDLAETLRHLKTRGRRMAAYGASAKGATLLNSIGANSDLIEYIVDDTPEKQGKTAPGTGIPIVPASYLASHRPDDLVILAWNFVDEILDKTTKFSQAGGRYIVPVPALRYIE